MFRRTRSTRLYGKRLMLRALEAGDFEVWSEVRTTNADWLIPWEPLRPRNLPDPVTDRNTFESRCILRDRDRAADQAYPFAMFVDNRLIGEINLNNVTRGALQSATIGYWIDQRYAGNAYTSEAVVIVLKYAFEQLRLHRVEICIVPRNERSRKVIEKLGLRDEGIAQRYLQIYGVWEDHIRYAITAEEWNARQDEFAAKWLVS